MGFRTMTAAACMAWMFASTNITGGRGLFAFVDHRILSSTKCMLRGERHCKKFLQKILIGHRDT
jgi:hypothetical protein